MAGIGALFSPPKVQAPAPVKQEVVKMPDRQDPSLLAEAERKRRKVQEDAGGGRDQTILTAGEPVAYGGTDLGK